MAHSPEYEKMMMEKYLKECIIGAHFPHDVPITLISSFIDQARVLNDRNTQYDWVTAMEKRTDNTFIVRVVGLSREDKARNDLDRSNAKHTVNAALEDLLEKLQTRLAKDRVEFESKCWWSSTMKTWLIRRQAWLGTGSTSSIGGYEEH